MAKTFTYKATITEEELLKLESENKKSAGKFFSPGTYDLKVLDFKHHISQKNPEGVASGDPTWLVYSATLGGTDARSIMTFVLLPTVKDTYDKPGLANRHFAILNVKKFLKSLGMPINSAEDRVDAINLLLNEPDFVVGRPIKVKIGYKGPYVKYEPETRSYVLCRKDGELFVEDTFKDRDSAVALAATMNLSVSQFPEVLNFIEAEVEAQQDSGSEW